MNRSAAPGHGETPDGERGPARFIEPALAARSWTGRIIAAMQEDLRLTARDVLCLALSTTMQTVPSREQRTDRPARAEDMAKLMRQHLSLIAQRAPLLFAAVLQDSGAQSADALLREVNEWARAQCEPAVPGVTDPHRSAVAEWRSRLEEQFILLRLPHVNLADGRRALDIRPTIRAVRRSAARKGVELPVRDEDLVELIKEVMGAPHKSVTRAGNLRWRIGRDGVLHVNENLLVDSLRTHFNRRDRPRGALEDAAARDDDHSDAQDALGAVLATEVGRACQDRGEASVAALFVHTGVLSFRKAARRCGVSASAVQRALPWVQKTYPELKGRGAAKR